MNDEKWLRFRHTINIVGNLTILTSIVVLIGWFLDLQFLLYFILSGASMKFNTALLFLITGIALKVLVRDDLSNNIVKGFGLVIIIIGFLSLIQYIFNVEFGIDNLIITDSHTPQYPGRMSKATAFKFSLLGFVFLIINSRYRYLLRISQALLSIVTGIALISTVTYILQVPLENKVGFIDTMAIHTSLLFMIISITLALKNENIGYIRLFTRNEMGSKLLIKLLPLIIIIPVVLSFIILSLINNDVIKYDFALTLFTVVLIILSLIYNSIIANNLNELDVARVELENFIKGVNADLIKANKELENKNKELEQFAYIASHDLQEPLKTVISFVDIINEERNVKDGNTKTYLDFIYRATQRMSGLISGLLEYSRIGAKRKIKSIDSTELLDNVILDMNDLITKKGASINHNGLPIVDGYKIELRLLFQNLLSNALKFGKVGVRPEVYVDAIEEGNYWKFSVKDNGIGIEEKYIDKIFMIFKRLHNKSKYPGSGIGLAHCVKIVEMHKGKIWVDSEPNEGSTFYFTLPHTRN